MYKTILEPKTAEIEIKKSKFIATSIPVKTESEAKAFVDKIKKEHHNARHNVYIYLIGDNTENYEHERYSGDGEPHGTAAIPVLDMYKKEGISNICTVITRYFGGIKLGTGGLVRAYTGAAKESIVDLVEVGAFEHLFITIDYHHHGKAEYIIQQSDSHYIGAEFTDKVKLELYISEELADSLIGDLMEATARTAIIDKSAVYGAIVQGKLITQ